MADMPDSIPADQFQPDPESDASSNPTPDSIPADQFHPDDEQYHTQSEQEKAGVEAFGRGLLGPLAPGAERLAGVTPEAMQGRKEAFEEEHPVAAPLTEAAGFGTSFLIPGIGEANVLSKVGNAAVHAGEAVNVTSRLAQAGIRVGTEMAAMAAGDEASKYLMGAPDSVGGALANTGLSSLIGVGLGVGGSALGSLASKALNNSQVQEFVDRVLARKAGLDPVEEIMNEAGNAYDSIKSMGSEMRGTGGLKDVAIDNLAPEMTDAISKQGRDLSSKLDDMMAKHPDYAANLEPMKTSLDTALNPPRDPISLQGDAPQPGNIFRTMDNTKRQLDELAKWNKVTTPLQEQPFRNDMKSVANSFRSGLEDSDTWGKLGDLQKNVNSAWSEVIPGLRGYESRFMQKIPGTNDFLQDIGKFTGYVKDGEKYTTPTVRQNLMGSFIDSAENFQSALGKAYESAGLEYPHEPIPLGALKDSIKEASPMRKMADSFYDTMYEKAAPWMLGGVAGASLGHDLGKDSSIPFGGIAGALLGGKLGEKILPTLMKPLVERVLNSSALSKSIEFSKDAIKGKNFVQKAAEGLFKTSVYPAAHHMMPDRKGMDKLNDLAEKYGSDPNMMTQLNHNLPYQPGHAAELNDMTARSLTYLNGIRPKPSQPTPLDTKIEPSPAQTGAYQRQLGIAEQPLSVMNHIKNGTLQPQDVKTLQMVSPALYNQITTNIQEHMVNHVTDGGTIPYRTKQSLSLLMGQPLDSTFTPGSIQAVQATYAPQPPAPQTGQAPKRKASSTAPLSKSVDMYKTPSQTAESDRSDRS